MTGIERLRKLSKGMHNHGVTVWQLTDDAYAERFGVTKHGPTIKNFLSDIADQIEREAQAPFSRVRVLAVISDMESRVSDEVGSFGALVARWARELRKAVDCREHDPAEDVSVSAYDLLPAEDAEAIAWVRDHGGLDAVDAIWDNDVPLAEAVISELWPDGRPDECGNDDVMGELRRRLVPEGCEWPRYESGEPVLVGSVAEFGSDDSMTVMGVELTDGGFVLHGRNGGIERPCQVGYKLGERVKRPAVIAADGEPLEVGQTVWDTDAESDTPLTVVEVSSDLIWCEYTWKDGKTYRPCYPPSDLTHTRPVLDADGVPIREGDTVFLLPGEWCDEWPCLGFHGGEELEVFADGEASHVPGSVQCREKKRLGFRVTCYPQPSQLTHTKPEPPDSWERIEEDAKSVARLFDSFDADASEDIREIVRRCKALAERERGE